MNCEGEHKFSDEKHIWQSIGWCIGCGFYIKKSKVEARKPSVSKEGVTK